MRINTPHNSVGVFSYFCVMIKINRKYSTLISSSARYHIVTGGRGSGKSFSINTILCLMMLEEKRTILFLRKTLTSAHLSIIPEFLEKLDLLGVKDQFHVTKTEIIHKENGSVIYFRGIQTSSNDNTANLKSLNGVSVLVVDEAEELTDEMTFDRIDFSVRQKGVENKVIIALNPCTKEHFLFPRFFEQNGVEGGFNGQKGNVNYIHTTYLDNADNLDPSFIEQVEILKEKNPDKFEHQILGGWKNVADGVIFENWKVGEFIDTGYTMWGADFGFSLDPNTLVKVSVDNKERKIYLKEYLYKPKLTTTDLIQIFKHNVQGAKIIADSAEPRLISELKSAGLNIEGAIKGQGSITAGISKLLDYELIVCPESINLQKELNNYVWNDRKSGVPIDDFNHLLDAVRYAVSLLIDKPASIEGEWFKSFY